MGNQLPGNPQNGQIVNNVLQNLANNPNSMPFMVPGEEVPTNAKALNKLKNNKFIRGQQSNVGFRSDSRPHDEYANKAHSPIHKVYDPGSGSGSKPFVYQNNPINYSNTYANSSVADPLRSPRNPQMFTPTGMNSRIIDPPKNKGFFQQLFNISDTESQKKLRSSSASHASISGNDRKISLLESNAQVLEKRLGVANQNLQNSQRGAEQLRSNLKNAEARFQMSETNLKRTEQKAFYLQTQLSQTQGQLNQIQAQYNNSQNQLKTLESILNQSNLQIQGLRQVLVEKDKRIYDGQIQIKTQMNQLQLIESRLQQLTVRDERKDKQIRQLSSAKFQLNATRIRLQNNLKINQEEIQIKNRKISQLDGTIINKNKQLMNIRQEKTRLEQEIVQLKSQLQSSLLKYEQQSNKLSLAIKNHLITIQENQSQILSLTNKVDKYHQSQIENQASISMLQGYISENKLVIQKLQSDMKDLHSENKIKGETIQQIQAHLDSQRTEAAKHRDAAEKIIIDYNNAKKIGQKQIQFLENKLEQFTKEKEKLLEQKQVTKAVTIQRNKIFERKIIYDLKQENDKLWGKLIQNSESNANLQSGDWRVKIEEVKNSRLKNQKQGKSIESKINKNQLQLRFDSFIKKLSQNENNQTKEFTQDISNQSLQKMQQNVQFYRQKCNQLQKMVESHIIINKNLKDQIQKNAYYEANFKTYSIQMEKILLVNKALKDENVKLKNSLDILRPESQLKQTKASAKSKQLQSQNAKFFQDIGKLRNQLQAQKNQCRKYSDEVRRLNNQISVYKKWQGLYDDLKKKYDLLMMNSKEDYKGMYEEVLKQLERLRNLYELKQSDFDKLKKVDAQKFDGYQKQIKTKNAEIQIISKDYDNLARQFDIGKEQYEKLFKEFSAMEGQLNNLKLNQLSKLNEAKF